MTATAAAPTMVETLLAKAKDRTAVFGVVGLGYVGLPLAMELVRAGYRVLGVDVNPRVVDSLNAGRSHIQDVPAARVSDAVQAKKFSATADLTRLKEPDVDAAKGVLEDLHQLGRFGRRHRHERIDRSLIQGRRDLQAGGRNTADHLGRVAGVEPLIAWIDALRRERQEEILSDLEARGLEGR